jgi:hypothetical protein
VVAIKTQAGTIKTQAGTKRQVERSTEARYRCSSA